MRTTFMSLSFFLVSGIAMSQQGIIWEPEITVADGSTYGNLRPRLSLASNDVPLVLLGKSGNGELFVVRGNGTTFDPPVEVTPPGMQTYAANWTGPDIASTGNNVVVVFKEQPISTGNIYAVRSTDGGLTFSDTVRVDNHDIGRTWMPALDMYENGNPFVTYLAFGNGGGNERVAVVASNDGGLTYEPQQLVSNSSPGHACDCCPPEILVKGQYQLALFRNNESNIRDTWGALSTDFGTTFTSTQNLDNLNWSINVCPATGPDGVIIGDSVYVASASRASGLYRVYVSSAGINGGLNLTNVEMMATPTASQNFPRISGEGDTLIVVWEGKLAGNTDVWCSISTDGTAQTLSNNKFIVNANEPGVQGKPDVIYRNGFVHLIYQDLESGNVIYKKGKISESVSLSEELLAQVHVFPNPSEGSIQISGISENNVSEHHVKDAIGNDLNYTLSSNGDSIQIELNNDVAEGIYFVSFTLTTGQVISRSFVVK